MTNSIDKGSVLPFLYRYGAIMPMVTVSPKFQVVIPKEVRDSMGIESGQKIQMLMYRNRIELIPIKPMKKMKGLLKGMDTDVRKDEDRV